MEENQENLAPAETGAVEPVVEAPKPEVEAPKREERPPQQQQQRPPKGERGPKPERGERGPRPENRGDRGRDNRGDRGGRPQGDRREGGRPGGERRGFEPMADIDYDKLVTDSLYLDNAAHAVVARMRDMDSGTKSQLRRLFNAVRRAVQAPESERQHQFVMLRARLAYTIARHSLRSLDGLERLLLQVTRKNDAKGYDRFKDLFEAIVAYNE
jgi:CRISPR type III-A-associated protein Csm2